MSYSYIANEFVLDVNVHERAAVKVVNGGEKTRPNVDFVLRHRDGHVRVEIVVTNLIIM